MAVKTNTRFFDMIEEIKVHIRTKSLSAQTLFFIHLSLFWFFILLGVFYLFCCLKVVNWADGFDDYGLQFWRVCTSEAKRRLLVESRLSKGVEICISVVESAAAFESRQPHSWPWCRYFHVKS